MHIPSVVGILLLVVESTAVPGHNASPKGDKACSNNKALPVLTQLEASSFCSSYIHVSTKTVITTSTSTITTPKTITLTLATSTLTETAALTTYTETTTTTAFTAVSTGLNGTLKKRTKMLNARVDVPKPLQGFRPAVISTACSCFVTSPTVTATQFPFYIVTSTYTDTATAVVTSTTTIPSITTTEISVVATATAVYRYGGQLEHFCYPLGSDNNLQGTEQDALFAQNYTQAFDYCSRVCYDDPRCQQFSTHSGYTSIPFTYDCFFGSGIPGQQGWVINGPEGQKPTITCQNFDLPPDRPGPYQRYMITFNREE
ncbi:hypothetical protein P171DRAFT_515249 [Karstenula rhodostoma CBS 690.94]|uniref:Apple domain-containing protein n=1 Tax=Karstenula rhodostoma CBS 690.94 TaxID=1392251 RepID=A0A9P4UJ04_9PLEO|nr:hypothetical protein P171DRAFT_515249 [Karstenula rhodostoma CBS 690.94]